MATMTLSGSLGVASRPVVNSVAYCQTTSTRNPPAMAVLAQPTWAIRPSPRTGRLIASARSATRKNAVHSTR